MQTIHSTSLEFVLLGPNQGRDRILVRSSNADVELIGFAVTLGFGKDPSIYPGYNVDTPDSHLHSVSTGPIEPSMHEPDTRRSSYRFCWVGKCAGDDRA